MARPLPSDPLLRQLIARAQAAQVGRRRLLQLGAAGAGALTLAACTSPSGSPTAGDGGGSLIWANWDGYMDTDDAGNYPTLETFQQQTGIQVDYKVDIDDNDTFYAKIQPLLKTGQFTGYDVACLTDWKVGEMVRAGQAIKLDHSKIPNFQNLNPALLDVDFDPGRDYTMTWQSGYAGLVYNKELVPGGIKSVDDLWKPEFAGKVVVLSEMRDTLGVIMLGQGVDISSKDWGDDEFYNALDLYKAQLANGQIGSVKGNSYTDDLENEDAIVGIVWSGDVQAILNYDDEQNGIDPRFEFVIPDAGGTLWSDNFIALPGSEKLDLTEQLINYYYDPEVAATLAAWVNYITPVVGAKDAMASIDADLVDNPLIFPTDEDLAKVKMFRTLTDQEANDYSTAWANANVGA